MSTKGKKLFTLCLVLTLILTQLVFAGTASAATRTSFDKYVDEYVELANGDLSTMELVMEALKARAKALEDIQGMAIKSMKPYMEKIKAADEKVFAAYARLCEGVDSTRRSVVYFRLNKQLNNQLKKYLNPVIINHTYLDNNGELVRTGWWSWEWITDVTDKIIQNGYDTMTITPTYVDSDAPIMSYIYIGDDEGLYTDNWYHDNYDENGYLTWHGWKPVWVKTDKDGNFTETVGLELVNYDEKEGMSVSASTSVEVILVDDTAKNQ